MKEIQLIVAAGILGYLLQAMGYILGMQAIAKKRVNLPWFLLVSTVCALMMYLVRRFGQFNFGVHTMLMLLIMNLLCVLVLKLDIMLSILGSLIVTALIIAIELLNYSALLLFYAKDVIDLRLEEPLFKAWTAVPGNILLIAVVIILYGIRIRKGMKKV